MFYRSFRALLLLSLLLALMAPLSAAAAPTPSQPGAPSASVSLVGSTSSDNAAGGTTYVVRQGDTLTAIARRYGVSTQALVAANGLRSANLVYAGQRLVIPGTTTQPAIKNNPNPQPDQNANAAPDVNAVPVPGQSLGQDSQLPNAQKLSADGAAAAKAGRWIDVNISTQTLRAYQGTSPAFTTRVSTGIAGHRTPVGRFKVRTKVPSQTMSGPGYRLPGVPWVMYFAGANAIHGTYWHHNFGKPMSHGCVNVTIPAAKWLYNWASIGTPVVTHY